MRKRLLALVLLAGIGTARASTVQAGRTFYEGPGGLHLVSRNAGATEPAKFIAFFVKDKGAPIVVPVR